MNEAKESRAGTFNRAAEAYDEVRPGYPDALIEDVIRLSGIPEGGRILEIGSGTGQATQPFAVHGYRMLCLEIGDQLAALAARRFAAWENVEIQMGSFEDWDPGGLKFDLVIAATSFHWIDPEIRWTKTASVLKPKGSLAAFSNTHVRRDEGFFAENDEIYRTCAPTLWAARGEGDIWRVQETGSDLFEEPVERKYPWQAEYDARNYIRLLETYSDHIRLPRREREDLFQGIRELINDGYQGSITKHYESVLSVRMKRE
jgi:SAM-dependent methyltransferase